MKKVLTVFVAIILVFLMVACENDNNSTNGNSTNSSITENSTNSSITENSTNGSDTENSTNSSITENSTNGSDTENSTNSSDNEINSSSSSSNNNESGEENSNSSLKSYLTELLDYYSVDPFQYVPEAMRPNYASNLIESPVSDFTLSVPTSSISKQGYGEQWEMIIENINQAVVFTKAFNVVNTTMNSAVSAINAYLDNSTSDILDHSIDNDSFSVKLSFKNDVLYLEVVFKNDHNVPAVGNVKPVIKLSLNTVSEKKEVYISLGDNTAIKQTVDNNVFELVLKYGLTVMGKTASRASYLSITKSNNKTTGHIYEYTSIEGSDMIKACADFYAENGYVSVVGNKASGMMLFTGYINEVYSEREGRLLGYKVQEELSGVAYNTLWFNLWDISGINSVKVTDKTDLNQSSKSTFDVYINDSNSLLVPTYNKKLLIKTSRKYDIELRSRFYYSIVDEKVTVNEVKVPMMFIQDDNSVDTNYTDFPTDFKTDNGIDASVTLSTAVLNKIRNDYDTLIPIFKENKDKISSETINTYLNSFNS